jgi:hypothetical protein
VGMGNDPVNLTDPNGGCTEDCEGDVTVLDEVVVTGQSTVPIKNFDFINSLEREIRPPGIDIARIFRWSTGNKRPSVGTYVGDFLPKSWQNNALVKLLGNSIQVYRTWHNANLGYLKNRFTRGNSYYKFEEEVSFELPNGKISRVDYVAKDGNGNYYLGEVKTGEATLSVNQKELFEALQNGHPIKPVGENARRIFDNKTEMKQDVSRKIQAYYYHYFEGVTGRVTAPYR